MLKHKNIYMVSIWDMFHSKYVVQKSKKRKNVENKRLRRMLRIMVFIIMYYTEIMRRIFLE